MPYNVNTFGVAAAVASLKDPKHIKEERARNTAVRDFTVKALADLGYTSTDSQTNFIFTDIGKTMTAAAFRDACASEGRDGRPRLPAAWKNSGPASRSARWKRCRRPPTVFRSVLQPDERPRPGSGSRRSHGAFAT